MRHEAQSLSLPHVMVSRSVGVSDAFAYMSLKIGELANFEAGVRFHLAYVRRARICCWPRT